MKRFLFVAIFFLSAVPAFAQPFRFLDQDDRRVAIVDDSKPVLLYRYDIVEHVNVPKSDRRRTAGCYVHPLFGLKGETLTDNAPLDHYHHHGIFWTWPHVGVHQPDGTVKNYDLWASDTDLKQHFVRWIDRKATARNAVLEVENGWFVGTPDNGDKIISEKVKITVHRVKNNVDNLQSRAVDFDFLWKPTDKPVSLRGSAGKSYGGFTMRFKPYIPEERRKKPRAEAKKDEANVITVSGGTVDGVSGYVAEKDLPETPLAWADYTSRFGADERQTGATIFVPKTHPDFPPTWLTRYYGPMCVGWPGVKDRKFEPGEEIRLRYRVWIHDGPVTVQQIEKAYEEYNKGVKM